MGKGTLRSWLLGIADQADPITQATQTVSRAQTPAWTPHPIQDDWATAVHPALSRTYHNLPEPDPAEIEWLYTRSDEWSSVVIRLRNEVWRRGLDIVSTHQKFCIHCGNGTDDPDQGCPDPTCDGHGDKDRLVDPDPQGKHVLEQFAEQANRTEKEDLVEVGSKKTEETLKHGRGYVIYHFQYELEDEGKNKGTIASATLDQVHAASSSRIVKIREQETGKPGGAFVCLACRSGENYEPAQDPGRCPACNGVLYEAWYAERRFAGTAAMQAGQGINWYLPSEVHETKWPYRDGSPPIARLMAKVATLLLMDWWGAWALDLKRDKSPDNILVTIGGDEGAIKNSLDRSMEAKKQNPYRPTHLHLPHPPGGLNELKMDAKVLNLGDQDFKGQAQEIRKNHEDRIRKQYHIAPMQGGDTEGAGGLNNDGQQLRSTAQVAEDLHNHERKWLDRIPEALGVTQWTYEFPSALEEDEGREAGVLTANLDNAIKAAQAGLEVRWEDGEPVIEDGKIDPQAIQDQQVFPGLTPPSADGGDMFGKGSGLDMDTAPDTGGQQPETPGAPETPEAPAEGQPPAEEEELQEQALNGAQINAILDIIDKFTDGAFDRESAINIIVGAFPFLSREKAERMVPETRTPDDVVNDPPPNPEQLKEAWTRVKQAIDQDEDLPSDVSALFGGPSGAVAASDAAFQNYSGLSAGTVEEVNDEIVEALTQEQGWSTKSIKERLQPILENAGLPKKEAERRALTIARTEPRAIASEWKLRIFKEEEQDRGQEFRYTIRGADDFRTTKLSRWIRQRVEEDEPSPGAGLPLEQILNIIDRGITLAKNGAFTDGGSLSNIPGDPIELPNNFQRRGTLAHYNDRDSIVRVV